MLRFFTIPPPFRGHVRITNGNAIRHSTLVHRPCGLLSAGLGGPLVRNGHAVRRKYPLESGR